MSLSLNIRTYLSKNTTRSSLMRGNSLFEMGAVKGFAIQNQEQKIEIQVRGTYLYLVVIKHDFENVEPNCSCPYNHGGICKHSVAALQYLSKYLENNPNALSANKVAKAKVLKKAYSTSWYDLGNAKKINKETVSSNISIPVRNELSSPFVQQCSSFLDHYSPPKMSFFLDTNWEEEVVEFKLAKGRLYTKCNCHKYSTGLCWHRAVVLGNLLEKYGENFFECLEPQFIEQVKQTAFADFGLPETENFDDYFELELAGGDGFNVIPTGKGEGLVKVNSTDESFSPFQFLENKKLGITAFIPEETQGNYNLAYCLFMALDDEYMYHAKSEIYIELIPIYGKLNASKTKLTSSITRLKERKSQHKIEITSQDENLIQLAESSTQTATEEFLYRNAIEPELIEFEKLKYYINLFSKALEPLSQQPYLFLTNDYYFSKRNLREIKVSSQVAELFYKLTSDTKFIRLTAFLKLGDNAISLASPKVKIHNYIFAEYEKTLYLIPNIRTVRMVMQAQGNPIFKTPKVGAFNFFDQYVLPLSKYFRVKITSQLFNVKEIQKEIVKLQLYITELNKFVLFQPVAVYEDGTRVNILKKQMPLLRQDKNVSIIKRDFIAENKYHQLLKTLHTQFKKQFPEEYYHLNIDDMLKDYWFHEAFEVLRKEGVEIFGLQELTKFPYSPHKANVSINIASGQDWFDVEISLQFGDYKIALNDIKKAVLRKDKFIKLSDGSQGILPKEWIDKFEKYFRHGQIKKGELKISSLKFSLIDELFEEQDYSEILYEIHEKKKKLKNFKEIKKLKIPKEIQGSLRDYQKFGYNWLNFLDEFSWGGILADDMGLGKTIQVISFLQNQVKKSKLTNLIVIPTTLLFNWKNELEKFAPDLIVHFHYGLGRDKNPDNFKDLDLIVTTYGLIINDIELLRKLKFNYIVLDESQAIKNPASKRFKAVSLLKAKNRIAMTGTPIENNTFDLYAQMDFVNPGFLGSQAQFKENYSNPIDKNQDPKRAAELQRIISPFVLRRTKEQVAKELPEKTEDYIYCTMEPEQRKVYDAFRNKYRNFLMNKIEEDGIGKSKIYVLEGLTKLRQICDSPALLPGEEDFGTSSVKIKELIRHIKEKTANHKILVFSQFVKMLKLIEKEIKKEAIEYEYLDGKSSKKAREKSVKNFQENPEVRVFLISLKAGGTGINLTEADYVYIVDPWWNPAVENQAIDRCHRIGQSKKVIAYRMICKDTIEEKIMDHQKKKKKIASDIISTDEGFVKNLTAKDINSLFD